MLSTDPEEARAIARASLSIYINNFPNYYKNWFRLGFDESDLADNGSDRLIDTLVAWGDEEATVARIRAHLDAGADHVVIQALSPEHRLTPEVIQRVADIGAAL